MTLDEGASILGSYESDHIVGSEIPQIVQLAGTTHPRSGSVNIHNTAKASAAIPISYVHDATLRRSTRGEIATPLDIYLNSLPRARPAARPDALRATRLPTLPFWTALRSPRKRASQ